MDRLKFDRLNPGLCRKTYKVISVGSGIMNLEVIYVNRSEREIVLRIRGEFSACTADQFDHRGYELFGEKVHECEN